MLVVGAGGWVLVVGAGGGWAAGGWALGGGWQMLVAAVVVDCAGWCWLCLVHQYAAKRMRPSSFTCILPTPFRTPPPPPPRADSAPDSPLNCDAGNLLRGGDIRGYNSLARMYTIEYALGAR